MINNDNVTGEDIMNINRNRELAGLSPLTEEDQSFLKLFGCLPDVLDDIELFTEADFKKHEERYILMERKSNGEAPSTS